jgi:branched-chain amino acid transport system permease protein
VTPWRTRLARGGAAGPLAAIAVAYAVLALPHASGYAMRVLGTAGIYALLAIGYGFIFGLAGALSLAQGAFMGIGAYVSGILATRYGIPFDAALPASIGLPMALALLVGVPVLRLQTHYFALATLLIGQTALLAATQWQSVTGGANGMGGVPPISVFGHAISGRLPTLLTIWAIVAAGAALAWRIGNGRLGDAYALLRANQAASRAIGIDTGRLRMVAFLLSAGYAGLAGSLYVHVLGVLSPDVLGFPVMVTCLTIAVVGSRLRVTGAVAGAVLIIELPEWARFLRDDYMLAFGCILLLVVVALPGGLIEALERLLGRLWAPPPERLPEPLKPPLPLPPARCPAQSDRPLLEITGLTRGFGGVRALSGVSLSVRAGEVVGLIGPNGSGKTTLVNAVTGIFPPESGDIRLAGHSIAGWAPHRIARLGIARSFQTAALAPGLSALDNVAIARDAAGLGLGRAMWAGPRDPAWRRARGEAMALLDSLGAGSHAGVLAASLPPGIARLVEIARALATAPRLLLLDEPAAGLNETEQADLARRLRGLVDSGIGLLVIEHNMAFLAPLADRLICLDQGAVIAAGTPRAVQGDPRVIEAYLGAAAPDDDLMAPLSVAPT